MRSPLDVLATVVRALDSAELPYMIVGSIASVVYGEPRMTHDLDIVIELSPGMIREFQSLFPEDEYYRPPAEVIRDEALNRRQFNLIDHASGFKIDFLLRKLDPHSVEEFARRHKLALTPDLAAWLASPEDVIVKKLVYYREGGSEKHIRDIRGILANTEIERLYLDSWIARLGLSGEWARVGEPA